MIQWPSPALHDGEPGAIEPIDAYVLVRAQLHDAAASAPRRDLAPLRN